MTFVGIAGAIPFGWLADRGRRVPLLATAAFLWMFAMAGSALAPSFALLFVARVGVGFCEAINPPAVSLLADYYPMQHRARIMGLWLSGAVVGAIVGTILGGVAVERGGWRWTFWMWVPFGALVGWFLLRQPEPRRGAQDGARSEAEAERGLGWIAAIRELARIKTMWLATASITLSQLLTVALHYWSIEYLKRVHHVPATLAGGISSLMGLAAVAGMLGGGFLADYLLRRDVANARVWVAAVGAIAPGLFLSCGFACTSLGASATLLVLGGGCLTVPMAPTDALLTDVVAADLRGRAASVRSVVRSVGAFGSVAVGALSDGFGLRGALSTFSLISVLAGAVLLFALPHYVGDVRRGAFARVPIAS
jgi:MFS family permease